jgi:hypothetical protein
MPRGQYTRKPKEFIQPQSDTRPRFIAICTGLWDGDTGQNHSLYGLDAEGYTYVYRKSLSAWVQLPTRVLAEV